MKALLGIELVDRTLTFSWPDVVGTKILLGAMHLSMQEEVWLLGLGEGVAFVGETNVIKEIQRIPKRKNFPRAE